jgi:hypothetical protein
VGWLVIHRKEDDEMMTFREAKQRCDVNHCNIRKTEYGDYRVVHRGWRTRIEAKAYYSDDLEDCALTSGALNAHYARHGDI